MIVTEPILTKITIALQFLPTTEFHERPSNGSVVDSRTDMVST